MKNLRKTNSKTSKSSQSFKCVFFLAITVSLLFIMNTSAFNEIPYQYPEKTMSIDVTTNPILQELLNRIGNGECFGVNSTMVTVRNDKYVQSSYTAFSNPKFIDNGSLKKDRLSNGIVFNFQKVAFSDRSIFNGKKDQQTVKITSSGNSVQVEFTLNSWSNSKIRLSNVKITKERIGAYNNYFITGKSVFGTKVAYYTIAIYKVTCLI